MDRIIRFLVVGAFLVVGLGLAPLNVRAEENKNQIRRILLPIEGFLVSRVPERYQHDYGNAFSMEIDGKDVVFAVRRDAESFILKMRQDGIELHFVSSFDAQTTKRLVERLRYYIYYYDRDMQARTLTRESFESGVLTLAALPGGARDTDLIATVPSVAVAKADRARTFDTGRLLYLFPTFEAAKENRRTARENAAKIPKTESEWLVDFDRVSALYFYVNRRNAGYVNGASLDEIARNIGLTTAKIAGYGRDLLANRVKPDEYAWNTVNGKLVCQRIEVLVNKRVEEPLSVCLTNLSVNYEFETDASGRRVSRCVAKTAEEQSRMIPIAPGLEECLKSRPAEFAWEKRDRSSCASFVPAPKGRGSIRLGDASADRCADRFSKVLKKDGRLVVFTAFPGWEGLAETELDKRIAAPKPNEENVERLWDTEDDSNERGVNLATCMDEDNDQGWGGNGKKYGHMKEDGSKQLLSQCRPDTLYSWGDENKFRVLREQMSGDAWKPIRAIFTTPGAVATFNYGPIPLRIKLRPGVKFKRTDSHYSCGYDGRVTEEQRETVYYRKDEYKDWVICSTDVIESWSHSMPQHYDEIIKDLRDHRRRPGPENVIYYYYLQNDKKTIFTEDALDGRSGYTEKVLKDFLRQFVRRVRENKGEVFYNPKTPPERRTVEEHFRTDRPLYFNQR